MGWFLWALSDVKKISKRQALARAEWDNKVVSNPWGASFIALFVLGVVLACFFDGYARFWAFTVPLVVGIICLGVSMIQVGKRP